VMLFFLRDCLMGKGAINRTREKKPVSERDDVGVSFGWGNVLNNLVGEGRERGDVFLKIERKKKKALSVIKKPLIVGVWGG